MAKKSSKNIRVSSDDKVIVDNILNLGCKYGKFQVFEDFICMLGYEISNSVDPIHYEERFESYKKIRKKYSDKELELFNEMAVSFVMGMEKNLYSRDTLGEIYHSLNLNNENNGQYFTPFHVCEAMAKMCLGNAPSEIKEKGYITICEPTCGSGAMLIAAADSLFIDKYNPSTDMCCLAVDNDYRCCMMAYIQLSLLGIPAVVVHGNSLTVEEFTRFYTPAYVWNGWVWREPLGMTTKRSIDDEKLRCLTEPLYYLMKYGLGKDSKAS